MKSLDMKKIAVLDDYQTVALESADWTPLNGRAEITVYNDHVDDDECLIDRLVPFDAICVMRERSPLPRKSSNDFQICGSSPRPEPATLRSTFRRHVISG